jgi:signal transduction histidine kinase
MSALLAALGWFAAVTALLRLRSARASGERRLALVAEAAHELRAPLSAALLGLHGVGGGGSRATSSDAR